MPCDYRDGALYSKTDPRVNGSGVHQWYVCMNYNLNHATGQFDGQDYRKYTQTLNILWQGDPTHSTDYMAAVGMAQYPGLLLAKLLAQLHQSGIEVNIIAHSLGNLVLLHALEETGKNGQAVEHVFMWEAAVPDNVFTTTAPLQDFNREHYYFPNAYQGANHITALYSHRDNVLGPLHYTKFSEALAAAAGKSLDPSSGITFAVLAVAVHYIDQYQVFPAHIKSVYNLANVFEEPLSYFFNLKNMEEYYQNLKRRITRRLRQAPLPPLSPAISLAPTFDEQILNVRLHHHLLFNDLSMIINVLLEQGIGTALAIAEDGADLLVQGLLQLQSKVPGFFTEVPDFLMKHWPPGLHSRVSDEFAALFITILSYANLEPRAAMGYSGPDLTDDETGKIHKSGKLILGDQHKWLTEHSSMKFPDNAMMEHVYKPFIWRAPGFKFGQYKK